MDEGPSGTIETASLPGTAEWVDPDRHKVAKAEVIAHGLGWAMCLGTRRRTVVQYPSSGKSLRGLWEEEETLRRQRQMIPEGVHKPPRSKILNRKPLSRLNPHNAQTLARTSLSLRSKSFPVPSHSENENQSPQEGRPSLCFTKSGQDTTDTDALAKKKHGPPAPATARCKQVRGVLNRTILSKHCLF